MSKSVTHEEVEDVLSSIRRLVSEDKRPLAGLRSAVPVATEDAVTEQAVAAPTPDRLVLTPALRVAPSIEVAASASTPEQMPEQTPEDKAAQAGHQDADAHLGDAGDEGPLDLGSVAREIWHPDLGRTEHKQSGHDPAGNDAADATLFAAPDQDTDAQILADGALEGDVPEVDLDALVHDAVHLAAPSSDDALTSDDALSSDGNYGDESYWDADDSAEQTSDADQIEASDALADAPQPQTEYAGDTAQDDVSDEAAPSLNKVVPLTAKIAALEAAMSDIAQDWEPDGDEVADLAGPDTLAMAWEDDVELDATGAPLRTAPAPEAPMIEDALDDDMLDDFAEVHPAAQTTQAAEDTRDDDAYQDVPEAAPVTGAAFSGDDQLMDEDALRDLVSEIVRQELQGALGERITRNVRKLVRREIHRALTAQELE
jgi:hypothetical protein